VYNKLRTEPLRQGFGGCNSGKQSSFFLPGEQRYTALAVGGKAEQGLCLSTIKLSTGLFGSGTSKPSSDFTGIVSLNNVSSRYYPSSTGLTLIAC
jgi:hypothetical protein